MSAFRLGMDIAKYTLPLNTTGGISGGFSGSQIYVWGRCQTDGPIGTKFGTRLWIHLGMDIGKTIRPTIPHGGIWGRGVRGSTIQKPGKCGQTA